MNLKKLQQHFYQALLAQDSALPEWIADNKNLSAQQSIDIYRHNMNSGLARALQTIYPACHRILGGAYFNQVARAYARRYPSTNSNLNEYGEHFADFLGTLCASNEELADFAYLPDLAGLEQRCHQAHYAADDAPFDFARLAKLAKEKYGQLVLQTSHSLSLLSSPYPIRTIRELNLSAEHSAATVPASAQQECLVIHRLPPVTVTQVSQRHYDILQAIVAGDCLAIIGQRFGELDMLHHWVNHKKWVQGFYGASV